MFSLVWMKGRVFFFRYERENGQRYPEEATGRNKVYTEHGHHTGPSHVRNRSKTQRQREGECRRVRVEGERERQRECVSKREHS